jgi:hypothetical protein
MDAMRESWTDARLDDLNAKVDRGFDRLDTRIDTSIHALRTETRTEFTAMRTEMKAGFDRVDDRFDALYRLMFRLGGAMIFALIGLVATQL